MKISTYIILLVGFMQSCDSLVLDLDEKVAMLNSDSTLFPFYHELDTLTYTKGLNIKEEVNLLHLAQDSILDTFELQLVVSLLPYCHWDMKKYNDTIINSNPCSWIYPTPYSKKLALPQNLATYSTITFIGKISKDSDMPVPELVYFYYKLKKPYFIFENKLQEFKVNENKDGIDSLFGYSIISVH
ncbi:MAG: hypothetical protein GY810_28910 [Aureispira sp.]|nr:hypothetical protein [Aureispira sp.]